MQTAKVWKVFKNLGNWLHDRHTIIENWFINSWENWIEGWHHCFAFCIFCSHFALNSKVGRFCIWFLKIGIGMKKKLENFHTEKKLNFRVASSWHIFWFLIFLIFGHNFKINQMEDVGGALENSGNLQQDGHKNFLNCWRNVWDNWSQSWQP